jgi:serine/threonine-protein kinase
VTGRLLAGRYEILERIGEGGTAEVFRARDRRLDRIVAVKVLRPQYGQDPEAKARFAVEARTAAALAVPNIVPVYDFGAADDGSLFIVMRYIDGPSLRRVISERGSLPAADAIDIGRQVAQALAAAHGHELVHRDVKPGNILLDAGGTAHLTDFGVVKALAGTGDLTRTGMTFGTAAYLSPEQATGARVGPRTDLYALGVVLYEALAGRPPFSGDDPMAVSYQHAHEVPTPLGVVIPGVDSELQRVVMQSLEKDPERRPSSAAEVATILTSIAGRLGSTSPVAAAIGASQAGMPPAVLGTTVSPDDATAAWSTPIARAPAWHASAANTTPISTVGNASPMHAGIATPAPRTRPAAARRRSGAVAGTAVVVLAIALVGVGTLLALNMLSGRDNAGSVAEASPTTRPLPTPRASAPAIVPSVTPTPEPPPAVTPEPPPAVTPEPPPAATPEPPPAATPEPPPPAAQDFSVEIPDEWFAGDYDQGSGRYHGRTASWVYGQGTAYHTMTASFQLTHQGQAVGPATLQLVGLDGENPIKNRMRIVLNGVTIHEGPNPLPNDECCGPSGPGNWGSAVFEFAGEILSRNNSLVISNLEPADCTTCPKYVMVDYGVLEYRARP